MTYARFEDLPVWNASQDLAADVFGLVDDRAFSGKGDLRDQLQRASRSISNNIAEGFERAARLSCFVSSILREHRQERRDPRCGSPRSSRSAAL